MFPEAEVRFWKRAAFAPSSRFVHSRRQRFRIQKNAKN
jgi:hypothetical protein